MSPLDAFLSQAWSDHVGQPAAVAERLPQALPLLADDDGVMALATLVHHVCGEHLARWDDGLHLLGLLAARDGVGPAAAGSLARCRASLRLGAGGADDRGSMSASDQCRVASMAAASLAPWDAGRACALLDQADAGAAALPDADPGVRALAANGNAVAGTLQDLPQRSPAQRALMLHAAELARRHWQRAGTWLEVERAEYRLALCWLTAGDAAQALQHGRHCDAIVREHGSPPLELFFAAEALALPSRALGDAAGDAAAVAVARQAFDALSADDQRWCRPTLDKLAAA